MLLLGSFTTSQAQIEIWAIQGTGFLTPYTGEVVTCEQNIVTAVDNSFFYLQTPDERSDNNVLTSDGIRVYLGQTPTVQVGDLITLSGTVSEYLSNTQITSSNAQITVLAANQALPTAVQLTADFPSGVAGSEGELERIEGMRVQVPEAHICGATTSNFARIKAGPIRSFREAGIAFPGTIGLPVWDNNPEVFYFQPGGFGTFAFPTMAGGLRLSAEGVFYEELGDYILLPYTYDIEGSFPIRSVRDKMSQELTIGSLNAYVLDEDENDYQVRLRKMARYILNQLKKPDVLALQEVENIAVLNDLIAEMQSVDPTVDYTSFLMTTSNSNFQINPGFLVSSALQDVTVVQLGKEEQASFGGRLHDRAPFLLSAQTNSPTPVSIKILNLHLRSLNGVSSSSEVRKKRQEQAISVAKMVQARQSENLIVLGDFNAFQFSDGYVDVYNQISGHPSEGASLPIEDIVSPPMVEISATVEPAERYSYVFQNNAQMIDHCLSTQLEGMNVAGFEFARGNADNSNSYLDDPTVDFRVSDHEGFVLFLGLETALQTNTVEATTLQLNYPNPFQHNDRIQLNLAQAEVLEVELIALDGRTVLRRSLGQLAAGTHELSLPSNLVSGLYLLKLSGKGLVKTEKIFIQE